MDAFIILHVAAFLALGVVAHCMYRIWKDPS